MKDSVDFTCHILSYLEGFAVLCLYFVALFGHCFPPRNIHCIDATAVNFL